MTSSENVSTASVVIMFFSIMTMVCGVFLFETVLTPGPTIPVPTQGGAPVHAKEGHTIPIKSTGQSLTLFVYSKDADRLARTLELDVADHGGWTVRNDQNRYLTFAVSEQYLDRIRPLINDSGVGPVGEAYRDWAHMAGDGPDPAIIGGIADTSITVNVSPPSAFNPSTLTTMVITGGLTAVAFLIWVCITVSRPIE